MPSDTKYGVCGVMASITVDIDGQQVSVEASGDIGEECTWQGMHSELQLRNASTQLWTTITEYTGSAKTWSDDVNASGYDRYKAYTVSRDVNGEQIHPVKTDWVEGDI